MKYYYALFKESKKAVEVTFPDLPGCVTFGEDWDQAVDNATDALAGWLAHAENAFINEPSSYSALVPGKNHIVPIPVDEKIMETYTELKRFNVIFPVKVLKRIDDYRKKKGLKRSTLLLMAVEEYLEHHKAV